MHVTGKIAAGIVVFLAAAAAIVLLNADALLNGVVRERILRSANSTPGTRLTLGPFHYSIFANRISVDSLRLSVRGDKAAGSVDLAVDTLSMSDLNYLRVLTGNGLSCRDLVVRGIRGSIVPSGTNMTGEDPRADAAPDGPLIPDVLLPLNIGLFSAEGGALARTVPGPGGPSRDSMAWFQSDIRDLHLESEGSEVVFSVGDIELELHQGALRIPHSTYKVAFASVRLSRRESMVRIDSLSMAPILSDIAFFASGSLRLTRFRLQVPRFSIRGINLDGLLRGEEYTARVVELDRPSVSIVVDMRKRPEPGAAKMPNEILTEMRAGFRIDSLIVDRGTVEYGELYPYSSTPATLRWTDVRMSAGKIVNRASGEGSSPVRLAASARFQKSARMAVSMVLPLANPDFSLVCNGSVKALPLTELNSFLEVAERTRMVSGWADSIGFTLVAENGRSTGSVHPVYRDLKIEVLAKESGRSDGLLQRLASLVANTFKINKENMPDGKIPAGKGAIRYVRQPGDPFFKFIWFSLRGGLGSVVGFSS